MPALLMLTGPLAGQRRELSGEVVLGRSPSCQIPLEDSKVSRRHARIALSEKRAVIADLGSRNGTLVNGEKVEGEVALLPGDRVQIGDSAAVFEPFTSASLSDAQDNGESVGVPVSELLPVVGAEAAILKAASALLGATNEAMVLRKTAEELAHGIDAELSAALLGTSEGLLTASVVGGDHVQVPRSMVRAALERGECVRMGGKICAPMAAFGAAPFGILYAERPEAFTTLNQRTCAALARLAADAVGHAKGRIESEGGSVLLGSSRVFRKTLELARRAAQSMDSAVIVGETGSGRTALAHYIHSRSVRALGPFVVVDCQKSAPMVEEALFGRPAAAGAPGTASALLRADRGTLVLRNLEAIPRPVAVRLGKALELRAAPGRSGGEEPIDVRVLAIGAGHEKAFLARGNLDASLSKALKGPQLDVAPLRERKQDVPALTDHFFGLASVLRQRESPELTPHAQRALTEYAWPGNIEELIGVCDRLSLLYPGQRVTVLELPPEIQAGPRTDERKTLAQRVAQLEKDAVIEALREARGKKIKAASLLGISRPTLDKKIAEFAIPVEKERA